MKYDLDGRSLDIIKLLLELVSYIFFLTFLFSLEFPFHTLLGISSICLCMAFSFMTLVGDIYLWINVLWFLILVYIKVDSFFWLILR